MPRPKSNAIKRTLSQRSRISSIDSPNKHSLNGAIIKNADKNRVKTQNKRFNHITVYEHLYLDGLKQQKKRTI